MISWKCDIFIIYSYDTYSIHYVGVRDVGYIFLITLVREIENSGYL